MSNTPAVEIRGLSKTFPGQRALIDVDLEIQPGEVRALVGQNGCGKSTLIKILAGYHEPDPGVEVFVDGAELALGTTNAGDHAGIRFVHQDLGLVPTLDARDNLAMGHGYERNKPDSAGLVSYVLGNGGQDTRRVGDKTGFAATSGPDSGAGINAPR